MSSQAEGASVSIPYLTAAFCLEHLARLKPGERTLILGASGAVGTAALQLARHLGAAVTAVCSGANAELVRSLGAAQVIDYEAEDFTRTGETYDVIMDCVGATSYGRCKRALAPGGRLLRIVAGLPGLLWAPLQGRMSGHRVIAGVSTERVEDMQTLAELARAGAFKPVVDSCYPFERIAEAHARVDTHRKRGNVVVTLSESTIHA